MLSKHLQPWTAVLLWRGLFLGGFSELPSPISGPGNIGIVPLGSAKQKSSLLVKHYSWQILVMLEDGFPQGARAGGGWGEGGMVDEKRQQRVKS